MGIKRKFFNFVIFSNIFIALCAVIMVTHSYYLFSGTLPPLNLTGFIFFATLASYSIHWYLTDENIETAMRRTEWLLRNKKIHLLFFALSVAGCSFFFIRALNNWPYIVPAVLLTLMYTAPKFPHSFFRPLTKFVIGKTILLAIMWTYVTVTLPLLTLSHQITAAQIIFTLNRFFLLFSICILFDLRDRDYDKSTGVKSIVTHLPLNYIKTIFIASLTLSFIAAVVLHIILKTNMLWAILAAPCVLTFVLYSKANKTNDDYLFYFTLDGLMALSGVLYFILI